MILVSACLLGCACRYDGRSKGHPLAQELARRGLAVPVCPEQLGGLATPRAPSEQREGRVVSAAGDDVTAQYRRGAEETLRLARLYGGSAAGQRRSGAGGERAGAAPPGAGRHKVGTIWHGGRTAGASLVIFTRKAVFFCAFRQKYENPLTLGRKVGRIAP